MIVPHKMNIDNISKPFWKHEAVDLIVDTSDNVVAIIRDGKIAQSVIDFLNQKQL